jgi:hypothetical protein
VKIEIDLAADAATVQWAPRSKGSSRLVNTDGRGVRLLLNERGDVVGVEVLGWSDRADAPADVDVRIHTGQSVEVVAGDDPLAVALNTARTATDAHGRPLHAGVPMLSLAEAARSLKLERSWLSREVNAGRLRAQKVGREWWTTRDWLGQYKERRAAARKSSQRAARTSTPRRTARASRT